MSRILIDEYFREIDRLRKFGGTTEQIVREAFKDLLKAWARSADLIFVAELDFETAQKKTVRPDGTVLHGLRVPLGWWEAKDTDDDLDTEISKKLSKGYPQANIIFENSETAVLMQNRQEVVRCAMQDGAALAGLVGLFFAYERPEIAEFRKAVAQFRADLPHVLEALRARIDDAYGETEGFRAAAADFLGHAKQTINPTLAEADVREMLIQHVLTEEIFAHVFNQGDFHRENNIAQKLYALEAEFFKGAVKHETLKALQPYYAAIRANAAQITGHGEKQKFLKAIYETFYKVYNPKAADRLGVVYTPNEIVRFMIEGADWLCDKHFGKRLIDAGVEILDPATGTGTFVCELIEHFRGQPEKLHRKYKDELHANEVAILPYYVANLNIEATYAEVSGQYAEFPNLCFVDTLDNVAGLRGSRRGYQGELLGALADENVERITRQNARRISVVIGNPPYNANQQNENEDNKNRAYPHIDQLIRDSYVAQSTAQKTKVYDMYARFFRWATDRLGEDGVIAFVSNSSFIDSRTFDGFRKCAEEDFSEIWIVDLKGNARTSGERRRREAGNVFDDQIRVGVAVSFWVRKKKARGCRIRYQAVADHVRGDDKRAWLAATPLSQRRFQECEPDARHNWINLVENEWDAFLPVAEKATKFARHPQNERAIFRLYSLGVVTNRDEWVTAFSEPELIRKLRFMLDAYNSASAKRDPAAEPQVKWTRLLKQLANQGARIDLDQDKVRTISLRPFVKKFMYFSQDLNEFRYQTPELWPDNDTKNPAIMLVSEERASFSALANDITPNKDYFMPSASQALPRYRHTDAGKRIDNITDWALRQFRANYGGDGITKDDIFHYVYAVLHDPVWRETYAINLKREFPRIPFYPNFRRWVGWGARLMALHIGYETVEPWPLTRRDIPDARARGAGVSPAVKLKADRENGIIVLDAETQLSGVPPQAWEYRLGNRSGLDWVLDQHREKRPRDPTVREKFDSYRFSDHKERVVDLLARVTRVSVETVQIIGEMRGAKRA